MLALVGRLQDTGTVHASSVFTIRAFGPNGPQEHIRVDAVLRRRADLSKSVASRFASILFDTYPDARQKDTIIINLRYGYDIGISKAWMSLSGNYSPSEWEKVIAETSEDS
jgi:hypothetical protein